MTSHRKRIAIDTAPVVPYFVSGRVSGIGRTTMELIRALDAMPRLPFDVVLYSQNMKGIGGRNLQTHFPCRHLYVPGRPKWNRALSHLPVREWLTRYDLMHITHNFEYVHRPDRCLVTIHDALFFTFPEKFLGHDFAREHYPRLARRARAVITCSENSKREIAENMDVPEERIFVTYWGVDHALFRPRQVGPLTLTSGRPYFLSVSCDVGRKNTISVLNAYAQFVRQEPTHDLVLVWRNVPEEIRTRFSAPEFRGKIHFVSGVSNDDLSALYAGATATFFPSRYEGFGLPVLESMACGTPVVTCRNSCLPEVGGDAAVYVDPDDVDAMAGWMVRFENGEAGRDELHGRSLAQAARFTWAECARKTADVYARCLGL